MRRSCFPNSGSHQHGPPLLGRVRTPPRSPTSALLCSPPTPSSPSAAAPVVPRKTAYPGAKVLFFTAAPVPPPTGATPETFLPRLPIRRLSPEEKRGSPRCLGHPLHACRGPRPRRVQMRPSPCSRCARCCLQTVRCPRHPKCIQFRGSTHTAHILAYLRFAKSVTVSGARLATDRAGSPLAGRDSHPLDDIQGFMESSHTPILLDQPCLVAPNAGIQ